MRIKFGSWIQSCYFVSNPCEDSNFINASTGNGLYIIKFETKDEAKDAFNKLLVNGYYDASDKKYSNYT